MEGTLHRQLKELYGAGRAGAVEVRVEGYRIDAVAPDGTLIEVQSGALGPIRNKVTRLAELGHSVRIVKPLVREKKLVMLARAGGRPLSARKSPKRGELVDVFDDLLGAPGLAALAGVEIEVVVVTIDELRVRDRRRRHGYRVLDRLMREVVARQVVKDASDLWRLLGDEVELPPRFTTRDLALALDRPLWFAQRVAYCLHHAGAAALVGKLRNLRVYERRVEAQSEIARAAG